MKQDVKHVWVYLDDKTHPSEKFINTWKCDKIYICRTVPDMMLLLDTYPGYIDGSCIR